VSAFAEHRTARRARLHCIALALDRFVGSPGAARSSQISSKFSGRSTSRKNKLADVQVEGERRRNRDRSFIVIRFGLYAIAIGLSVLYLVIRGACCGADVFNSLMEIVKVGILPILTLVIGYYFGTKDQTSNPKE
jgi:nitrate reductase NapE component